MGFASMVERSVVRDKNEVTPEVGSMLTLDKCGMLEEDDEDDEKEDGYAFGKGSIRRGAVPPVVILGEIFRLPDCL